MCHVRELIARWQFFRGSTPLFRSPTNLNYAASAYQLRQMVRSVFQSAGINASPGSLRRVVADQSFTEGQSLASIQFRGNWRRTSTLQRHYLRK